MVESSHGMVVAIAIVFTALALVMIGSESSKLSTRIFRGPVFNAVTWATIVLASVWGVAFFFSILFECTPIDLSLILPPVAPQIHCIDQTANFWGLSISDVLIDVIILCTPFPFVWNLQMSTKHKWGVSGMFLLGALYVSTHAQKEKLADLTLRRTIAASIARLVVFINAGTLLAQNDPDFTYYVAPTAYVVLLECSLAITSACLPVLRPLFSTGTFSSALRYLQSAFSLRSNTSRSRSRDRSGARNPSRSRSGAPLKGSIKLDSRDGAGHAWKRGAGDEHSAAEKGQVVDQREMAADSRGRAGVGGEQYVAEIRAGSRAREAEREGTPRGIRVQREFRSDSRPGAL
ncbi:hypothetical protein MMC10_004031 [Thelotrema lepadinum]|nr:hypothetical protein [Thelotrema lepadinum]